MARKKPKNGKNEDLKLRPRWGKGEVSSPKFHFY